MSTPENAAKFALKVHARGLMHPDSRRTPVAGGVGPRLRGDDIRIEVSEQGDSGKGRTFATRPYIRSDFPGQPCAEAETMSPATDVCRRWWRHGPRHLRVRFFVSTSSHTYSLTLRCRPAWAGLKGWMRHGASPSISTRRCVLAPHIHKSAKLSGGQTIVVQ